MRKYLVTYEVLSTRVATVTAYSPEEALENFNNEYNIIDDYEDDSYVKNVHEDDIKELKD